MEEPFIRAYAQKNTYDHQPHKSINLYTNTQPKPKANKFRGKTVSKNKNDIYKVAPKYTQNVTMERKNKNQNKTWI